MNDSYRKTDGSLYTTEGRRQLNNSCDNRQNGNRNNDNRQEPAQARATPLLAVTNDVSTNYTHQQRNDNRRHNNRGPLNNNNGNRQKSGRPQYKNQQHQQRFNHSQSNPQNIDKRPVWVTNPKNNQSNNRQTNNPYLDTRGMDSGNACKFFFETEWSNEAHVSSQFPLVKALS